MSDRPIIVTDSENTIAERSNRRSRGSSSAGTSVGITVLLILSSAGIAALGWFVWTQNSVLGDTRNLLADALERTAELESRLSQTQGELNQSGISTEETLGFWESEIRKLWAVSNERNRDWINENQEKISDLETQLAEISRTFGTFSQSQSDLDLSITQLSRQVQSQVDTINTTNQVNKGKLDEFDRRIRTNEDAVKAIDQSRLQNNNRLLNLEQRIRNLETDT